MYAEVTYHRNRSVDPDGTQRVAWMANVHLSHEIHEIDIEPPLAKAFSVPGHDLAEARENAGEAIRLAASVKPSSIAFADLSAIDAHPAAFEKFRA